MDTPQPGEWYEVDPREFGDRFVWVSGVSRSGVEVGSENYGYFGLYLDEWGGVNKRGPVDPKTGELL